MSLIQNDVDHWQIESASMESERENIQTELEEMIRRQKQELLTFLNKSKATELRKMPLFFAELLEPGSFSDFAWPTSEKMKNHKLSFAKFNGWFSDNVKQYFCLTSIDVVL